MTTRELIQEVKLQVRLILGMADLGYEPMPMYVFTGLRMVTLQVVDSIDDPVHAKEVHRLLVLYITTKLPFRLWQSVNWKRGLKL